MHKVSIIIPIYNSESYLEESIANYLNQDYSNIEFILVDDGSSDNSLYICYQLASLDNRIKVIHQENRGVSAARNTGIKCSTGDYICFFDSDDLVEYNMISYMVDIAVKTDADLVSCGIAMELQTRNGKYVRQSEIKCSNKKDKLLGVDDIRKNILGIWEDAVPYNVVNKLYKRNLITDNNIEFSNLRMGEDLEFNSHILFQTNKIVLTPYCFYRYIREREGAATSKYVKDWFKIREEEHKRIIDFFKGYYNVDFLDSKTNEYISRRFINRVIGCMENEFRPNNNQNKYDVLKEMIDNDLVQESLHHGSNYSFKIKIIVFGMKNKLYAFSYTCIYFISIVKKRMPRLFEYLKYRR